MKKTTSKALASVALTGLIAGIIPAGQVSAASTDFTRLSGKDRYLTAVEVSKAGWVEGSEYAVVANGEAYADALAAAPFAKKNNAPILLTSSKTITNETINELKRLKVKKVYVIGETGVVPNSILEAIKKNVTTDVERIGGQDRYETSVKIAEKLGTVTEAILASGEGYADALSAAPVAAVKGIPVLLTQAGKLPKATSDYIKAQDIERTFVVGGTASVSNAVKGLVPNAIRFGGQNRFETNSEIIKGFALEFNFDGAYVALANGPTGKEFADALTASAIAAKGGHPVVISNKTADAATTALINEKLSPTTKVTAIGGTANLSDALVKSYQVKAETITSSKDVTGNAVVTKDGVELEDMKVTGNLYLEGDNATLNNVEVTGTIFINPGEEGSAALNNVKADKIVVLSGASKSIHLNNVTCNYLYVSTKTQTRVVLEGTINIENVEIFSQAILEALSEFKGNIVVLDSLYARNIEFVGEYSGTINIKGDKNEVTLPGSGPIGGGGGGGSVAHQYKVTITNGDLESTINLGKDATIADVYDTFMENTTEGDSTYNAVKLFANLAIERLDDTKADGKELRIYIGEKLREKNADSKLADILLAEELDKAAVKEYLRGKTFTEVYDLLNEKTGGTITLPLLAGETRTVESIEVNGEEIALNGEVTVADVLDIAPETKLSQLKNKEFSVVINFVGDEDSYEISAKKGVLKINNSTITLK